MAKMWPQRNALYHNKYVGSCIRIALKIITFLADNAALCVIVGAILEFFNINDHIGVMKIIDNRGFHLFILFIISFIELSNAVITSLGRKTNPALMLAVSFLFIILVGSGVLLMPRCIQPGVHLSWIDSLFTTTSAVCVTGLTTIDVPSTFTEFGQLVIMALIQVGGLGIMTITSFFALFFMGNTSIYNQMLVSDMVSSKSLASLWSTLLNIFGFTAILELGGAVLIFLNIHGTIGLDFWHELFFSVFHSVSAFCNAGFSNYPEGLSSPVMLQGGHCWLYMIIALLIILGGIGYPVLVNLKIAVERYATVIWKWINGRHYASLSIPNLFDLNTKIVLRTSAISRETRSGVLQCRQSAYGGIHQCEPEQHVHPGDLHLHDPDVDRRCVAIYGRWCEGERLCRGLSQHPGDHPRFQPRGVCRTGTFRRFYPSCQCSRLHLCDGAGVLHLPGHTDRPRPAPESHRLRVCVGLRNGGFVVGYHLRTAGRQ